MREAEDAQTQLFYLTQPQERYMKKQDRNNNISLIDHRESVLCKIVSCLLIISFLLTNSTYACERTGPGNLRKIRMREASPETIAALHEKHSDARTSTSKHSTELMTKFCAEMGPELIDAKLYPMCPTIRDLFSVAERFNTVIQMPEPGDASYGILQTNIPQARKLLVEYVRRLLKEGDAQEIVAAMDAETDRIAEEKYRAVVPDEERAELLNDIMRTALCPEVFLRRMDGICVRGNFYSDVAAELGVPEIAIRRLFGIEEGHDLILVRNRENLTDHYNALMEEILHVIFDDRRRGSEDRVVRRLQYIANEMLNDWLQTIFHTEDNWPVHHRMHAFYPLSGGDSLTKNMQVQALNRQYDMNPNTELLPMMRRLRRDIAGNAHINIQKSEDLSVWDIFAEESRYGEVLGTLPQEACDHHDLETEDQKKEWAKEIFLLIKSMK